MIFEQLDILIKEPLDRNNMKEDVLYLFNANGVKLAAWLEEGSIKVKQVSGR